MKLLLAVMLAPILAISNASDKSDWPETSAMYAGISQKEILVEKQEKMVEIVKKIRFELELHKSNNGKYLANLFQQHHENWVTYINSTCNVVGVMTGAGGSWPSHYALKCSTNMTDQRLFSLTNTLICIKRHVKNQRHYEIPNCLYQSFTIEY